MVGAEIARRHTRIHPCCFFRRHQLNILLFLFFVNPCFSHPRVNKERPDYFVCILISTMAVLLDDAKRRRISSSLVAEEHRPARARRDADRQT